MKVQTDHCETLDVTIDDLTHQAPGSYANNFRHVTLLYVIHSSCVMGAGLADDTPAAL